MKRLTTDDPQSNTEVLLNYAYAKNSRVILTYGEGEEDIDLCEYISIMAKNKGCNLSPEEIMDGACIECDCELAILYAVATQAAELRARLKQYEDTGLMPEEILKRQEENSCFREDVDNYEELLSRKHLEIETLEYQLNQLQGFAETDRRGLLVELPCKPLSPVWLINNKKIHRGVCVAFEHGHLATFAIIRCDVPPYRYNPHHLVDEFGKTVFLSEKEAQEALEEMKREQI